MDQQRKPPKDTIPAEVKRYFFKDRQPPNLLTDYDVVGFDLDHCLVKYNVRELVKFLIDLELSDLLQSMGYPKEITQFDTSINSNLEVCLNGAIFDIDRGLVIQIAEGLEVIRAMRGFKQLSQEEIMQVYGSPPTFRAFQWPNTTHLTGPRNLYWVYLTYFDTPKVVMTLKALELKDKGLLPNKTYRDIAFDIRDMVFKNYVHYNEHEVQSIASYGGYFPAVVKDPKRFIQYQPELRDQLQKLKDAGKLVFISSNSHMDYCELILQTTLGDDWEQFFDITCCYSRKPLFFWDQKPAPFYELDRSQKNYKGKAVHESEDLKLKGKYLEGNSKLLTNFFKLVLDKPIVKVAYFGDQYITDVYASSTHPYWEGIAVVEELLFYDGSYAKDQDAQLIKYDKYWGANTFFVENGPDGKNLKRSYFITQLEDCARYMLPLMKNMDLLMWESGDSSSSKQHY